MFRLYSLAGAFACFFSVAFAYWYMQSTDHMGLAPCPLCILQRILFVLLGLVLLFVGIANPRGGKATVYVVFLILFLVLGFAVAGYHTYLLSQYTPPNPFTANTPFAEGATTQCITYGPDMSWFDMMLDSIKTAFNASGDCGKPEHLWGLWIPVWSLIAYGLIALTHLPATLARRKLQRRLFT